MIQNIKLCSKKLNFIKNKVIKLLISSNIKMFLMSIIITGSSGFIGRHLLNYLLKITKIKIYALIIKTSFQIKKIKFVKHT